MPHEIFWTALSRFHDWTDKKFPSRMLQNAVDAGLVGPVEWISVQERPRRPLRLDDLSRLGESLFARAKPRPKHKIIVLEAGGTVPAPWRVTAHLPPFVPDENRLWGYGVVSIIFDQSRAETEAASAVILNAFAATNTPDVTEYACIHPYDRLLGLRAKEYDRPVTFTPFFAGAYWANFLGEAQLELFDLSRLRDLKAYRVSWTGDRGLLLVITPNLADAEKPESEREMERITEVFRKALK